MTATSRRQSKRRDDNVAVPSPSLLVCAALLSLTLGSIPATAQVGVASGYEGVPIEYEVVSKGAPNLVFVHGWMCDRTFWREQRAHYSDRFGVVLLDLGGHGSSGSGRDDWTIGGFARDVVSIMDTLDLTDVILVGHSMGGPVIAEAALLVPNRIRAVVGVDTYQYLGAPWLRGEGVRNLVAPLRQDFVATTSRFVNAMFPGGAASDLKPTVLKAMTAGDPAVGVPSTQSMFEWYRDRGVRTLAAIDRPLWTINSVDYVGTDVERLQGLVPGIGVRMMDDVGHFVMLQAPGAFNQALDEILARIVAR